MSLLHADPLPSGVLPSVVPLSMNKLQRTAIYTYSAYVGEVSIRSKEEKEERNKIISVLKHNFLH